MTAPARALLDALASAGVSLRMAAGARVRWTAPAGVMTPSLLAELRQRKTEVMTLLVSPRPPCALGEASVLYLDGRRNWRLRVERGELTEAARRIVRDAASGGVGLVADGDALSITAQPGANTQVLDRIGAHAADVLAELHHASDLRIDAAALQENDDERE